MSIKLTDELQASTTKGKIASANQVFLNGDSKNLQTAYDDNRRNLETLDNRSSQIENSLKAITVTGGASVADAVSYENSTSGLLAINTQSAIDEVSSVSHFAKRGSIINISTNYSNSDEPTVLTLKQAITKIPVSDRVLGFQGKYLASDGWRQIFYVGENTSTWTTSSNWIEVKESLLNSLMNNASLLNISTIYPNGGIDNTYKYTFDMAVSKIPDDYRRQGITCSFINASYKLESYTFLGGDITDKNRWIDNINIESSRINDSNFDIPISNVNQNIFNISALFPNDGDLGGNKYSFNEAIKKIPTKFRKQGVMCCFLDEKNYLVLYIWAKGDYSNKQSWVSMYDYGLSNSTFMGVANLETNPGIPSTNVFYITTTPGTYTNFNNLTVLEGQVCLFIYIVNTQWVIRVLDIARKSDLTSLNTRVATTEKRILEHRTDIDSINTRVNTLEEKPQGQEKLISGQNIKTINGESILGYGDLIINDGGGSEISDIDRKILNHQEYGQDIQLGEELVKETGWTTDGWTGDFNTGFQHTIGETKALIFPMSNTEQNFYLVEFDVTSPSPAGPPNASTAFTVTLGNSPKFITYRGAGSMHYKFGIKSISNGDFKIIPCAPAYPEKVEGSFDGKISNITIKQIISPAISTNYIKDKIGTPVYSLFADKSDNNNIFIGKNTGLYNIVGENNVSVGNNSLSNNTSGFWNTAIGVESLEKNTVGSRNCAIGYLALQDNVCGDRNYAIGTFALKRNIDGRFNIAVGADTLWSHTHGQGNIALGSATASDLTDGNYNVAIGHACFGTIEGSQNIAMGYNALGNSHTANNCIAIGYSTLKFNTKDNNVAIGAVSLSRSTTGYNNVAVGAYSLTNSKEASECVAIGHYAGGNIISGTGSVFIGANSGKNTTGNGNIFIGYNAGQSTTSGYMNVLIGRNVSTSSATASYELNIANLIFGDINEKKVGINKQTDLKGLLNIPSSDGNCPQIVLDKSTLTSTPIAGGLEFDGTNLYLTLSDGSRKKIKLEQ